MSLSKLPQWAASLRLSLREMFLLVALVAVAIVSLKYASDTWQACVAAITLVASFGALIVAAIDRGPRQAFAIGFSLVAVGYTVLLIVGLQKDGQFHFSSPRLPTLVLRRAYVAMREARWVDPNTQALISDEEAQTQRRALRGRPGAFVNGPQLINFPRESYFMPIGQCWWTILLAYVGGRFARHIYTRREREKKP